MTSNEIKTIDSQNVMQTYGRFDAVIERGEGARLYSPEGKEYIDFTSGIGVNSIGYGNKKWADAVYTQAMKLQHVSNLYYSEPYAKLAERLTARTGMKNVFFANAGGEANEGMIKLARKYSFDKYGKGRSTIISLMQSFHGRTITTLAATGQESFHNYFFPFTEGFEHVAANDIKALETLLDAGATAAASIDGTSALKPMPAAPTSGGVCAILLELIQGEGGVLPLDPGYVKAVAKLCTDRDLLLLIDEVQTGVGRTGALFAFQHYGIVPDVVSFAKGIAGGLPMGGIMANEKCAAVLTAGTHATTFGGNPISAAGALEVLNQLDDGALAEVTKKGQHIAETIKSWGLQSVGEIRGKGLMLGISMKGVAPKDVAQACVDDGLLILTAGADALRMLPPLTITYEEIDKGLAILKKHL
ncbi:MAG: acetylornithine/succinylornithine family transaminase [Oscillospiraceae bacterium]|nr:acetylornithine/succinylornithine family transaminase [Oscillospiraceae bacterium]